MEVLGMRTFDLVHPDDRAATMQAADQVMARSDQTGSEMSPLPRKLPAAIEKRPLGAAWSPRFRNSRSRGVIVCRSSETAKVASPSSMS